MSYDPKTIAVGQLNGLIADKRVVVVSKSYCPYCKMAKKTLSKYKISAGDYEEIEIDESRHMDRIQHYMKHETGASSVPRVFIGGKFVGGADDVEALHKSGKLKGILQEAGAI